MSNFRPLRLPITDDMKDSAVKHKQSINKSKGERFRQYHEDHNYFAELGELAVVQLLEQKGFKVIHNKVYGTGNEYDLEIEVNGIRKKFEVKVRRFDSGFPNENWYFPIYFKEWIKMIDWYTEEQTVDIVFFVGYGTKNEDVYLYGMLSPSEILKLYNHFNMNDDLANKQKPVRYYPKGYWLGGCKAVEKGLLTTFKMFKPFEGIYDYLGIDANFACNDYVFEDAMIEGL